DDGAHDGSEVGRCRVTLVSKIRVDWWRERVDPDSSRSLSDAEVAVPDSTRMP
ncbi:hypothetical protein BGZ52_007955, partial [Haplosporangium bisporale]